ncbi:MAG: MarR family transcriptional regulator [Candidatus Heimdallarchaeota archaeon]|nr:MarR family transcriptional regulator [Candidatus Heimdallarchaeota archaeon]MCK4954475.1 MarR family transcriptional regulator [Candidatus Heimdallarchaeota archaeon]
MHFSLSSFDSDNLTCFDIIKAVHALTDSELEILSCIHQNQPIDMKEIISIIPKDRATVSRSIRKLMTIGFVRQDKINLARGGYKYQYYSMSIQEIRDKLSQLILKISNRMIEAVSTLTEERCRQIYEQVIEKYNQLTVQ